MKRWPLKKAHFWETAPFFRILLPFAAGIILYELMGAHRPGVAFANLMIAVTFVSFGAFMLLKKSTVLFRGLSFLLVVFFLFFCGYSVSFYNDIRNDKTWFGNSLNTNASYLVRVNDFRTEGENSFKLPVTVVQSIEDGRVSPVHGKALLYLDKNGPMMLNKGDSIFVPGKWLPIKNAGNPFEFDYTGFSRRNNLLFRQYCAIKEVRLYATNDPERAPFIDKIHTWCTAQLEKYIPDPKTKNLLEAMLLGDEVNLDQDLRQSYADTGIVHIIAISGGNVAIFFIVISFLLRWLRNKKHLWLKYAIALPLVWLYVMMAGAAPSAVRAALMFSLLAFGIILQKNNNSLNQLFATAFLLLCAQPMWLFSVGFQLSFVAVLSLILFYRPVYRWVSPVNMIAKPIWSVIAASIAAEVLVAPLVIYYFHTFPVLFLVANVIAYLFMSAVLVLGIAIILAGFMPPVASAIGWCTAWLGKGFNAIIAWMQNLNPDSFRTLVVTNAELIIVYAAVTGFALFLMRKQKPAFFAGLGACCILLMLLCSDTWASLQQQRLVVYNTGHTNVIETFRGNTFSVVYADTSKTKKTAYARKPAHIYWHTPVEDTLLSHELTLVNGKKILVLNDHNFSTGRFPVNYLVINTAKEIDPELLNQIFSPAQIIVGNTFNKKQKDKFFRECKRAGIGLYDVAEMGAFVLN